MKSYLRYEPKKSFGVIASPQCNITYDCSGNLAITGALQEISVWNLRQANQVSLSIMLLQLKCPSTHTMDSCLTSSCRWRFYRRMSNYIPRITECCHIYYNCTAEISYYCLCLVWHLATWYFCHLVAANTGSRNIAEHYSQCMILMNSTLSKFNYWI